MRAWGGARRAGAAPGLLVRGSPRPPAVSPRWTSPVARASPTYASPASCAVWTRSVRPGASASWRPSASWAASTTAADTSASPTSGSRRRSSTRSAPRPRRTPLSPPARHAAHPDAAHPGSAGRPGGRPRPVRDRGPPTAVFCGNDHMALGALEALRGGGAGRPRGGLRRRLRRSERGRPRRTDDRRPGGRRAGAHRGPLHPPPPGDAGAEEAAGLSRRVPAPVLAVRRATAPPRRAGAVMPAPAARGAQDGGAEDPRTDSPLGGRTSRRCGASGAVMRSMIIRAARPPWAAVDRPTEVREMGGSAAR